jgi:hypothetical protein
LPKRTGSFDFTDGPEELIGDDPAQRWRGHEERRQKSGSMIPRPRATTS